jgi:hypothetical protein
MNRVTTEQAWKLGTLLYCYIFSYEYFPLMTRIKKLGSLEARKLGGMAPLAPDGTIKPSYSLFSLLNTDKYLCPTRGARQKSILTTKLSSVIQIPIGSD